MPPINTPRTSVVGFLFKKVSIKIGDIFEAYIAKTTKIVENVNVVAERRDEAKETSSVLANSPDVVKKTGKAKPLLSTKVATVAIKTDSKMALKR